MAIAAPVAALRKLAQTLPLGEGEGSQGGPPLDTKTDEQVVTPPPANLPAPAPVETPPQGMAPGLGAPGGAPPAVKPVEPVEPKAWTPESIGAIPVKPQDQPKTTSKKDWTPESIGAIPVKPQDQPKKEWSPEDTGAVPVKTEQPPLAVPTPTPQGPTTTEPQTPPFVPPEANQPNISPPPVANLPYVPAPMPSGTGVSAPQGSTTDPQDQIAALVAQGLSSGAAQAIIAGQTPKTISGDKPAPPKPPKPPALPQPSTSDEAIRAQNEQALAHPQASASDQAIRAQNEQALAHPSQQTTTQQPLTGDDAAAAAQLDKNLGGLLKGQGATYVAMGKKYGVDPRLLAAISMEETGNGTSHLLKTRNNVGGITGAGHSGVGGDYMPYSSIQEGIEAEASLIRHGYVGQGLDTIDKIGAKWAPGGAENDPNQTNTEWPAAVRKYYAVLGGSGKLGETKGGYPSFGGSTAKGPTTSAAPSPEISLPSSGPGSAPLGYSGGGSSGGGGGGGAGGQRGGGASNAGDISFYPSVGGEGGGGGSRAAQTEDTGGSAPPRYQPQQMSVDTSQADPMIAALTARGFTPVQALNYAQSLQNVASAKGLPPINVKGPAPAAPSSATPIQLSLTSKQPIEAKLLSAKQLMPSFKVTKAPPAAPSGPTKAPLQLNAPPQAQQAQAPQVDPTVIQGLMKRGFTRQQALAFAAKATVNTPQTKAPPPAPAAPQKPQPQAPQKPVPQKPASDMPPQRQVETPAPKKQAPEPEPTEFTGRPAGSTHGNPNPPGMEALTGSLKDQSHQHKALLSEDDPRVTRQKDNLIKGEHFVEGDPYHDQLLGGLPYGKQGPQRQKIGQAEQAIADDQPMHISYISSPKELEKFPTRESRRIQYEKSSPEARLMKATEGALVGHSMIPLNVGVKLPTKAEEKEGETHQGYTQGISTNVMANNFQHINDKLEAMGRKTPYPKLGAKFANDLEGYYSNLLAGHTATGRSYAQGTEDHPNEPDREHVPYKLTRKEADFINLVINNTSAFASHDDAKKIRELARANGTLITEKGETNRLAHDIEQIDPGWHGREKGGHGRVLEPSIKTFKTGLIHEIHPTEQHLPDAIRPGKEYQLLTKALARTVERGRPDIAIGASLHHTFQDNKKINEIERDFSDHKIDEASAREQLKALGEDPDDYRYVGGSGGLITPYEDDPEALTPEEHTQMKDNLRQSWVSGKMNVEDYRKKSAEVPLPSKPSKPAPAPKPVAEAPKPPKITVQPKLPESETPESSASLPVAQPKTPKPPKPVAPPEPKEPEAPEEKPETPPAAPSAPAKPKQLEPSRVQNSYAKSGDKVHWLPTSEVDKRWQDRDKDLHIPPGGTKNTIGQRYQGAKEYLQSDQPVNAPRAHVDEKGGVSFIDGRHRFAAMRDMGHTKVPVALTEDAHENAAKTGLTESTEAPKKAPAPDEPLPPVAKVKAVKPAAVKPPEPEAEEKLTKPAGAADKAWMKDPKNEAERQAYLEKRVAASIGRQNTHPSAIPLKVQRNEAGGVQHDPQLNPVWEKTDYNIADTPFLQKHGKGLSQLEGADKHEDTLGENEHKHLIDVERKRLSAMRNASAVHTMGDHIVNSYNKIKDIPEIAAGKGWYSRMRDKMAKVFGAGEEGKASEDHELFAQLLGATSAKTPVRDNFIQALDAFEQYKAGKFDRHIAKYKEAYQAMQDGGYEALNQKMREQGLKDEDGNLRQGKSDADAMAHWIDHHKIRPLKQNGAKYNSNSDQVLKVLSGTWLKEVGAPKTPNFAGNLTGRTLAATIDVWAARHLHRIAHEHDGEKKGWRPQSSGEPGVNSLDFAFSQDAMKHAADKIGINPDDLQAILWYAEKQHYDKHGWTGAQGAEKGSFDETWDKAFPTEGKAMTSQALQKHYQDEKARDDKLDDLRSKVAEKRGKGESQEKVEKYMKRYADEFLGKHGYTREHLEAPPAAPGLEEEAA